MIPFTWYLFEVNFLAKKRYCRNGGLGLAWGCVEVSQVGLFITTHHLAHTIILPLSFLSVLSFTNIDDSREKGRLSL